MPRYTYLLFDADNTLFDFEAANHNAFAQTCQYCGLTYSEELYEFYESINRPLWHQLDRGEVTKDFLVVERFRRFLSAMKVDRDPAECNRIHLAGLGSSTVLLPHALEVVEQLSQTHKLYIVTNAVASVQRARLSASAISPYITAAFISEEAGAAKPSRAYFDYVMARIDGITAENCLVIGDSLSSDIQGAVNAGLPACWYNLKGEPRPADLPIDYEIRDLRELYEIV
jgi:YjjG family noncanonical pyrimidine nucleotidase